MKTAGEFAKEFVPYLHDWPSFFRVIQRDAMAAMRDAAVRECNTLIPTVTPLSARVLGDRINSIDIDGLLGGKPNTAPPRAAP